MNPTRRRYLQAGCAALACAALREINAQPAFLPVLPGAGLHFPRDHGAHDGFRSEWWYITGWLRDADKWLGFQLTFFRAGTGQAADNPSRFAPRQLLVAHAALAVPGRDRLEHAQLAARAGFDLANASGADTDVHILDWSLRRAADDTYLARITAPTFELALQFTPPGPPLVQGDQGYSRKGPGPGQASYYYSRPQLAVAGSLRAAPAGSGSAPVAAPRLGPERSVAGIAWLDHEWSSELLAADAVGWDWAGINFDDGSALMAFRIRRADGSSLWRSQRWVSAAELRGGTVDASAPANGPEFSPLRSWRSPRSGASYPVAMRISSAGRTFDLVPMFDDQEIDASASAATIYWEGAVVVVENGRSVGRGYLELTGYASRPPV